LFRKRKNHRGVSDEIMAKNVLTYTAVKANTTTAGCITPSNIQVTLASVTYFKNRTLTTDINTQLNMARKGQDKLPFGMSMTG
jgi:hypothetical protein